MESELSRLIDALPALIWTAQPDGRADYINRQWSEYAGLSLAQAAGTGWLSAIHPDDRARVIAEWEVFVTSGQGGQVEARLRRADGVYRWFNFSAAPLADASGRVVKWCGINTDIDDRKRAEERRAEEALLDGERYARWIMDTIPGMTALMKPNGEIEAVNHKILEYFGRSRQELEQWGTSDAVHPEDLAGVQQAVALAFASGHSYEVEHRIRGADGVYRWHQSTGLPLRDATGQVVRYCCLMTSIEDRKRTEEALLARERNLKTIINTLPTTAWSTHPDGYCDFLSDRWLDYAGYTADEAAGWGWGKVLHPEDAPRLVTYWQECLSSGTPVDIEARMRRFDGEYRWFLFRANPLRDINGTIVKWYGTNIDIEDRKRTEQELWRINGYLQEAQRLSLTGSFTWDIQADEHYWSEQTFRIFELDPVEKVSIAMILPRIHPADMEVAQRVIGGAADGADFQTELRLLMPDGSAKHIDVVGHRIPEITDRPVFVGCIRDITERKHAEEKLRRTTAQLMDAEALSKTGSVEFDFYRDIHLWSDETYKIFEVEYGAKITKARFLARFHPDDVSIISEFIATAATISKVEFRLLMPDGRLKYARAIGYVTSRIEGLPIGTAAIQDITEQRISEQALDKVRSELAHLTRVSSLGALTASIAHEVNQPLSGIITNASTCVRMLDAEPPNIGGARETARRTIRDGNRAAEVITRLRALFTGKTTRSDAVDLSEATREVIALSANELQRGRVILQDELAEGLPAVTGDRVQLQQVVLNLLLNAIDALSGVVDRPRQVLVRNDLDEDGGVRLAIQDVGVGFEGHDAEWLFEAFHTTKPNGMGIGLSVSRSIVESHGGRLWAQRNEGPGATFAFSIPARCDT